MAKRAEPAGAGQGVKSAERALNILSVVAERGSVGFNELLAALELPRSSGASLLRTMVSMAWLEHDPRTRQYSLGLRAWQVGQRYAGHRELANIAKPVMDELAAEVGETVQLARLDGIESVYLAISEAPHPMRLASSVGMHVHAHATGLGKALLGQLPAEQARARLSAVALPRFTANTVTSPDEIMERVDQAREQGYAVDDEEYLIGCRCVAVPLLGTGQDGVLAAMSITTPTVRTSAAWPEDLLGPLRRAAERIRRRLG